MKEPFKADMEQIRVRAQRCMQDGALTEANLTDAEKVIDVLNEVLATEIICVLRYKDHFHKATGIRAKAAAEEFQEHAAQEQDHADWVAKRITQLGGTPNLSPEGLLARGHSEFGRAESLDEMLREDLVAERIAIETYSEIIRWLGNDDPTTRRLMEEILAVEEEHANDLANLMEDMKS